MHMHARWKKGKEEIMLPDDSTAMHGGACECRIEIFEENKAS